jgi:hypothetical protein
VLVAMDAETGRCYEMERFNQLDWPIQKERILGFCQRYPGRLILDATGIGDPIYDDLKRVYANIEGFKLTSSSKTELIQRLIVAVEQRRVCWPSGVASGAASGLGLRDNDTHSARNRIRDFTPGAAFQKGDADTYPASLAAPSTQGKLTNPIPCPSGQPNASHGYHGDATGSLDPEKDRIQNIPQDWEVLTNEMKRYEYEISSTGRISYNAPSGYHDDCVIALALANHGRWETGNCGRMLRVRNQSAEGRSQGAGRRRRTLGLGRRRSRVLMG